jgi:SAM-dependent methyltransferase
MYVEAYGLSMRWIDIRNALHNSMNERTLQRLRRLRRPASFGILRQTQPISRDFGWDRGEPIGRKFFHDFIDKYRADIAGRVVEIRDDRYSSQYPDLITKLDILDIDMSLPKVTIVADLASMPQVPSDSFDCAIVNNTFEYVWDFRAAIAELHRILSPGGVLFTTMGAGGRAWRSPDEEWPDLWRFHPPAARRLFGDQFGDDSVETEVFGNALVSIASIRGAAIEDVDERKLLIRDPYFPTITCVRAVKKHV